MRKSISPVIFIFFLTVFTIHIQAKNSVTSERPQRWCKKPSQSTAHIRPDTLKPAPDDLPGTANKRQHSIPANTGSLPIESAKISQASNLDTSFIPRKIDVNLPSTVSDTPCDSTLIRKHFLQHKPIDTTATPSTTGTLLQQASIYPSILKANDKSRVHDPWHGHQGYLASLRELDRSNSPFAFFLIVLKLLESILPKPTFPAEINGDYWEYKQKIPRKIARREENSQEYHYVNPFVHNEDNLIEKRASKHYLFLKKYDYLMGFLEGMSGFQGVLINDQKEVIYQYQDSNGNIYSISQNELKRLHSQFHESIKLGIAERLNGRCSGLPAGRGYHRIVTTQRMQKVKAKKLNDAEIESLLKQVIDESENDESSDNRHPDSLSQRQTPADQKQGVDKSDVPEDVQVTLLPALLNGSYDLDIAPPVIREKQLTLLEQSSEDRQAHSCFLDKKQTSEATENVDTFLTNINHYPGHARRQQSNSVNEASAQNEKGDDPIQQRCVKCNQTRAPGCQDMCQQCISANAPISIKGTDENSADTTESEKKCPNYQAHLVTSPQDFDRLTDYYRQQEGALAIIQVPDDLLQGELLRRTVVTDNKEVMSTSGQLFNGERITLILDFRHMSPAQMAELNGLFEEKPLFYNQPIHSQVSIVSVIAHHMIREGNQDSETSPYGDFWRRVNQSGWHHQEKIDNVQDKSPSLHDDPNKRVPVYTSESLIDERIETIDFTCNADWRALLTGYPGLDQKGQIRFVPGTFSALEAGTLVILKGAPWNDPSFTLWLADTLDKQVFQANGTQCALPDNLNFARADFTGKDIDRLLEKVIINPSESTPNTPVCLNQCNFAAVMSQSHLTDEGIILPADTFSLFLKSSAVTMHGWQSWFTPSWFTPFWPQKDNTEIRITSPLSHPQWLTLMNQINRLQDEQDTNIKLWVDQPEKQPVSFRAFIPPASFQVTPLTAQGESTINILLSEDCFDVPETLNRQSPLIIDITPDSQLSRMSWDVLIASMNQRTFDVKITPFLQALQQGSPVLLRGADSNPDLLQELETLLASPVPFLWLWGNRIDLPKAQIHLLFTPGASVSSPVWRPLIDQAQTLTVKTLEEKSRTIAEHLKMSNTDRLSLYQALPSLESLHKAMSSLPHDPSMPSQPPVLSSATLSKIAAQALLEKTQDQSAVLSAWHWRKAVNSVMLKEYRAHREAYSWLKTLSSALFRDPDEGLNRYDAHYLTALLQDHPTLTPENLTDYYWQLARGFGPALFDEPPLSFTDKSATTVNTITHYLDTLPHIRQHFAKEKSLQNTDLKLQDEFQRYNSQLEKTLTNAFMSIKLESKTIPLHVFIRHTASELQAVINTHDDPEQCKQKVREHLQQVLFNSSLSTISASNLQTLADDLVSSHDNRSQWLEHRLERLEDKVRRHRLVFLKGDTGAGKSWSARAVARKLNPQQPPFVITIGPSTSDLELFGETLLQDNGEDQQTQVMPGPVLQWAVRSGDLLQILIIDEATLASPRRLDWLNGLFAEKPFISWQGKPLPLTDQHRIILTSNPENFDGRSLHPALREQAVISYYQALPYAFLDERIAAPVLNKMPIFQKNAHWMEPVSKLMKTLWKHYLKLLPDRELTPRDMQAITQRIKDYLEPAEHETFPSLNQIHGVIRQSFRDILDGTINQSLLPEITALNDWLDVSWPVDMHRVDNTNQHFEQYYTNVQRLDSSLPQGDQYDFSNEDTKTLAKAIWWDLQASIREKQTRLRHNGRHATLIEGPPGRGKDSLLARLVLHHTKEHSQSRPVHINAGLHNWEAVKQAIETARLRGDIVIISELNLLPSKYLEGILNQLLDGDFKEGFHLFATINPEYYSGRQPLSPALRNRMSCHQLKDYSLPALSSIVQRLWPENPEAAKRLVQWHWQLVDKLQQHRVKPTASNLVQLIKTCRQLVLTGEALENALRNTFSSQYKLYLLAAHYWQVDNFFEHTNDYEKRRRETEAIARQELLPAISQWLQQVFGDKLPRPITIIRGPTDYFHPDGGRLEISEDTPETLLKAKAIELLAKQQWNDAGLPLTPPDPSSDLFKALFQLWQQEWATRRFRRAMNITDTLFPIPPKDEAILKMPLNKAIVQQARTIFGSTSELPSLGHLEQLFQLASRADPTNNESDQPDTSRAKKIDGRTQLKIKQVTQQKIFNKQTPNYTRMSILHMRENEGSLQEINLPMHSGRLTAVTPCKLPNGEVLLTRSQDYGVFNLEPPLDLWHRLPSAHPHERIVAVRTEPTCDYQLAYDWATGQHQVKITHSGLVEAVQFHYVIESIQNWNNSIAQQHSQHRLPELMHGIEKLFQRKPALKKLFDAQTPTERVNKIIKYINGFSANKDVSYEGGDTELLLYILENQQGVCRHQSWCFYALATFFKIPARLLSSESIGGHSWCEHSVDGKQWKTAWMVYKTDANVTFNIIEPDGASSVDSVDSSVFPHEDSEDDGTHEAIALILTRMVEAINTLESAGETRINPLWKKLAEEGALAGQASRNYLIKVAEHYHRYPYFDNLIRRSHLIKMIDDPSIFEVTSLRFLSQLITQVISFPEVKQFLTVMHTYVTNGTISKSTWIDALNDALREMNDTNFLLYYYPLIVKQEKWLDQVTGYEATVRAHQLRSSLKTEQWLKGYCKKSEPAPQKSSHNAKPWTSTSDFSGRSESLENALKLSTLQKSFSFEPLGSIDVSRLIKRDPMFCIQQPAYQGQRNILINANPSNKGWLIRQNQDEIACGARLHQRELLQHLFKVLVDQYPAAAYQGNNHLLKKASVILKKIEKMAEDALLSNNEAAVTLAQELRSIFYNPWYCLQVRVIERYTKYREDVKSSPVNFTPEEIDFTPVEQCAKALAEKIAQSFCYYLFNATLAKDGNLQVCHLTKYQTGAKLLRPSSVNALWEMLDIESLPASPEILKHAAQNRNLLILTGHDLDKFHDEFVTSMDINALLKHFIDNEE